MLDWDDRISSKFRSKEEFWRCKNRRTELLELAAQGKLQPEFVRRLIHFVKPYRDLAEEVSSELYARATYNPQTLSRDAPDIGDCQGWPAHTTDGERMEVVVLLKNDQNPNEGFSQVWWT